MNYASAQDMRDRYPEKDLREITDPEGAAINDAALDSALRDASGLIDGYLAGRYVLPLAAVPQVLVIHACNIAMYNLQALRPLQDIEDARKRYEDSIRFLEQLAKGSVTLGLTPLGQAPAQEATVSVATGDRVFSRGTMGGF